MNAGLSGNLVLVSALAGFNRTTLLGHRLAERDVPVAWLSLSESDDDPGVFISYLVAAPQTIEPCSGEIIDQSPLNSVLKTL